MARSSANPQTGHLRAAVRRKDGTLVQVEVTSFVAKDDKRAVHIASFKDITGLKRAEQEKSASKPPWNRSSTRSRTLIFYKDRDGRYIGCNTAYAAVVAGQ
jgi:PAS domain-containing protein